MVSVTIDMLAMVDGAQVLNLNSGLLLRTRDTLRSLSLSSARRDSPLGNKLPDPSVLG